MDRSLKRPNGLIDGDHAEHVKNGRLLLPTHLVDYPTYMIVQNLPGLRSLGNLRSVAGILRIENCPNLCDLGDLEIVFGSFTCLGSPHLKDLGRLKRVIAVLNIADTGVTSLDPNLIVEPLDDGRPPVVLIS